MEIRLTKDGPIDKKSVQLSNDCAFFEDVPVTEDFVFSKKIVNKEPRLKYPQIEDLSFLEFFFDETSSVDSNDINVVDWIPNNSSLEQMSVTCSCTNSDSYVTPIHVSYGDDDEESVMNIPQNFQEELEEVEDIPPGFNHPAQQPVIPKKLPRECKRRGVSSVENVTNPSPRSTRGKGTTSSQ